MKTEEFINDLTSGLTPVKPLARPWKRTLIWVSTMLGLLGASYLLGILPDSVGEIFFHGSFLLEVMATFLVAAISTMCAFLLAVPRERNLITFKWWIGGSIAIWGLILLGKAIYYDKFLFERDFWRGIACSLEIMTIAILPGVGLMLLIKRAAPTNLGLIGFASTVSVLAFSAIAVQLTCSLRNPMHLLSWHLLPVLIIGAFGIYLGRKFFRW